MLCEVHQAEMKLIPAGVSKKTGKAYSQFYACQVQGCTWRPPQNSAPGTGGGWQGVREQVAQKVAPEKASMTREDWEEKERRTNKNILLQVAFKAAVELATSSQPMVNVKEVIYKDTLEFHTWLLSQTEGQKLTPVAQEMRNNIQQAIQDDAPFPTEEYV